MQQILDRVSFADVKGEARALEGALELVGLGRPELALEICAKASPARRALATWNRVLALAAQQSEGAASEASALAEEWLRPADSTEHRIRCSRKRRCFVRSMPREPSLLSVRALPPPPSPTSTSPMAATSSALLAGVMSRAHVAVSASPSPTGDGKEEPCSASRE